MSALTKAQLGFLSHHEIPLSRVFDASSLSRSEYQSAMKALGMVVAYGVSPCKSGGHTLRTRAGHCAQCNTAVLAYQLRNDAAGYVYVAYSAATKLVKVGTSGTPDDRMAYLNWFGYGGASDWRVHQSVWCERSGQIEFSVHGTLSRYRVLRHYKISSGISECYELFSCAKSVAVKALRAAAQ